MALELENVKDEKILRKRKRCIPESITNPRGLVQEFLRSLNQVVSKQISKVSKIPIVAPVLSSDTNVVSGELEEVKSKATGQKLADSIFESYDPEFVETPPRAQDEEDSLTSKRRKRRGSQDSVGGESDQEFKLDDHDLKKVKQEEDSDVGADSGDDDLEAGDSVDRAQHRNKKNTEFTSAKALQDEKDAPQVPLSKDEKLALFRDLAATTKKPSLPSVAAAATSSSGTKKKGVFKRLSSTLRKLRHG